MQRWTYVAACLFALAGCKNKSVATPSLEGSATTAQATAPPAPVPGEPQILTRPKLTWAHAFPAPGPEKLAFSKDGSLLVAGGCKGKSTVGGKELACDASIAELYVAKLDAKGNALWVTKLFRYFPKEVDLAVAGDDATVIGHEALAGHDSGNAFVARIDAAGKIVWTHRPTIKFPNFHRVAMNAKGEALFGLWSDRGLPPAAPTLLTKLDARGAVVWSHPIKPAPDRTAVVPDRVAIDDAGNVAAILFSMKGDSVPADGGRSLVGLSPKGDELWRSKAYGGADCLRARGGGGGWIVSGGVPLPSVTSYDAKGAQQWERRAKDGPYFSATVGEASGTSVVFGRQREFELGGKKYPSAGGYDLVLARFDATGASTWVTTFPGPKDDYSAALAVSSAGQIAIAAGTQASVDLGGTVIKNETKEEFGPFVAVLGP